MYKLHDYQTKLVNQARQKLSSGKKSMKGMKTMVIPPKKPEKHGMTGTRIHNIWRGMRSRCYNPNVWSYQHYGGKGISMCDEWNKSFMSFYKWAMLNGYKDNLTIDRIDVHKNYEPSNCRWLNIKAQENNRSNNRRITFKDETRTEAEWAEKLGINKATLNSRLVRYQWTVERAFTTPVRKQVDGHYV